MEQFALSEVIERIERMEQYFDRLHAAVRSDPTAVHEDPELRDCLRDLLHYYENGQWLQDYELDEQGHLPADLKRGVLSQDGVFDLLAMISNSDRSI